MEVDRAIVNPMMTRREAKMVRMEELLKSNKQKRVGRTYHAQRRTSLSAA
jgi:hypothetical protein